MKNTKKIVSLLLVFVMCFALLAACASETIIINDENTALAGLADSSELDAILAEEYLAESESQAMTLSAGEIGSAPSLSTLMMPVASGTKVYKNGSAEIDASNISDGYTMVRYLGSDTSKKLKVLVKGPSGTTYQYNLNTAKEYEVFPLSDGNGSYTVGVYQNISGTKYSTLYSTSINVSLSDEFAPYLLPNQYVNYTNESLCVKKAAELTAGMTDTIEKVTVLYNYVVQNFRYDTALAKTVQSGYLPDLDQVFEKKSGICFDYASLLTAMLRSRDIPTKLIVGYAGTAYHAWINVYSEEDGWINGVIFFDGTTWKLMDPTFASSGKSSSSVMKYIGDGNNYTVKYQY